MNNELQKAEKRLSEAQEAQAGMSAELDKTAGELDRLDVTIGDVDTLVDQQMKLGAKAAILGKRLALATAAVEDIQGDLLIAKADDAARQLAGVNSELEKAMEKGRGQVMALVEKNLDPRQYQPVHGVVLIMKEVRPLLLRKEYLEARNREAAACATDVIRARSMAEHAAHIAAQAQALKEAGAGNT